jgi:aarF domain-containing kinase
MPPGPVYNWLAVTHSALVILNHALQYRTAQITRVGSIRVSQRQERGARGGVYEKTQEVKDVEEIVPSTGDEPLSSEPTYVQPSSLLHANEAWLRQLEIAATPRESLSEIVPEQHLRGYTTVASMLLEPSSSSTTVPGIAETRPPAAEPPVPAADVNLSSSDAPRLESSRHLQSSKVPSSRIGRLFHYGGIYLHDYLPARSLRLMVRFFRPRSISRLWRSF